VLIALNVLMFAAELLFGKSTDVETLYKLGALYPAPGYMGEWWRFLTSTFLHFGHLHLLMNMLSLYLLGPFVEYRLGAKRFAIAYFVVGMGSMLVIMLIYLFGLRDNPTIYVGASGSIMGLIGSTAAILLREQRQKQSKVLSRRLSSIALVVVVQTAFDLTTPQISFTAHAAGICIGFLAVVLMNHHPAELLSKNHDG
jgi:rhomboid protease GluP